MSGPWWEAPDTPAIARRIAALLGSPARAFRGVPGGYTPVRRAVVTLEDGRTAFVKIGVDEATAGWLRAERRIYAALSSPHLPAFLGFDDAEPPILALEDLSGARWTPPWDADDVTAVRTALSALAAARPAVALAPLSEHVAAFATGWGDVAAAPRPFLALGHVSAEWLQAALPRLVAAEDAVPFAGDDLVHLDVRSDNLCITERGAVLFDWNLACRGNRDVDVAFWLPSLAAEGGPPPEAVLPDAPELAAWVAGFFAARAGLPDIPSAPRVRHIQRVQLATALPWAIRALGLPPP